jgi:hypothetical protein
MPRYAPSAIPDDCPAGLKAWLADELRRVAATVNATVVLEPLGAEPTRPRNGLVVYADGTNWDPGSGEGIYGYEAGAWVKL